MSIKELSAALRGVCTYKNVMEEPVMQLAEKLLSALTRGAGEEALEAYTTLFGALRQSGHTGLGSWLWEKLRCTETVYSKLVEKGRRDPVLEESARWDVETLLRLAQTPCHSFIAAMGQLLGEEYSAVLEHLPRWSEALPFDFDALTECYRVDGSGLFVRYRAFVWERGELIPVLDPDCPRPEELMGYELQRNQVVDNTRLLVEGKAVNNALLFGDGGTGKSATVKSLLYLGGMEALRLIEVDKGDLGELPRLIRMLRGRKQKFILFIDDLAFDQDDRTYSALKTILEGSLERRPSNVAVYATSNRRHLVRQTFSDRAGDEVDAFETIAEKTALAERFGLRIPYLTMKKGEYLALVDYLAGLAGVEMEREGLHAEAMKWEIRHAGRTPRTAKQFIASLGASGQERGTA